MITKPITIEENETLKNAIKLMNENNIREIIVVNNKNEYKGIIKLRDIITEKNLNEKIKNIRKRDCKVYEINESEISRRMLENDCYIAAYLDKSDKVIGMIHIDSLLEKVKEKFGNMKVEEIETKNIVLVNPNETIFKVIKLMAKYNISHIPIVENGKIVGIVSSKDVTDFLIRESKNRETLGELIGKKYKIFENPITSIASRNVITYSNNEKISYVIKKLLNYKISCLVKENLLGIITKKDLIKPLVEETLEKINVILIGKENVKSYYLEHLESYIKNFIKRAKKHFKQGFLKIHIEKSKDIYSIHITFSDYRNYFHVKRERREFLEVLQECFDILKREVLEDFVGLKKDKRILEYLKYF
ncbi:MAG: CBS domain-containing protein [Candidatus Aenigmatarchaeota archaeon]